MVIQVFSHMLGLASRNFSEGLKEDNESSQLLKSSEETRHKLAFDFV